MTSPRRTVLAVPAVLAALAVVGAAPRRAHAAAEEAQQAQPAPHRPPPPPERAPPGRPQPAPEAGSALPGLAAERAAAFAAGKGHFVTVEGPEDGLGPVFNESSCVACHASPAAGGDSNRTTTRFGRWAGGNFDPLANEGGSLLQDHAIAGTYRKPDGTPVTFQPERVPADATVIAQRKTPALFGLGLVDAVPDATFEAAARFQLLFAPEQAGRVSRALDLASGKLVVGKFGHKGQVGSLAQFSGDAYLNEMGITSPLFPSENCPQGDCSLLDANPRKDLNDTGGDVIGFTDFMTLLAPVPRAAAPRDQRLAAAQEQGERVFASVGCAVCHLPTLRTAANREPALSSVTFHPYSDFLLHEMGALGDGIVQGAAGGGEMRTIPLWGLRTRTRFLHDGRATTAEAAIAAHDGQGARARDGFHALRPAERDALLAFLAAL